MNRRSDSRGALLIEAVVALSIFVGAGLAIIGVMRSSTSTLREARTMHQGIDLARSALAQLEAGIATPDQLDGPVPRWTDDRSAVAFEDSLPAPGPWELEIETERSAPGSLTTVTVIARRVDRGTRREVIRLVQAVALSGSEALLDTGGAGEPEPTESTLFGDEEQP